MKRWHGLLLIFALAGCLSSGVESGGPGSASPESGGDVHLPETPANQSARPDSLIPAAAFKNGTVQDDAWFVMNLTATQTGAIAAFQPAPRMVGAFNGEELRARLLVRGEDRPHLQQWGYVLLWDNAGSLDVIDFKVQSRMLHNPVVQTSGGTMQDISEPLVIQSRAIIHTPIVTGNPVPVLVLPFAQASQPIDVSLAMLFDDIPRDEVAPSLNMTMAEQKLIAGMQLGGNSTYSVSLTALYHSLKAVNPCPGLSDGEGVYWIGNVDIRSSPLVGTPCSIEQQLQMEVAGDGWSFGLLGATITPSNRTYAFDIQGTQYQGSDLNGVRAGSFSPDYIGSETPEGRQTSYRYVSSLGSGGASISAIEQAAGEWNGDHSAFGIIFTTPMPIESWLGLPIKECIGGPGYTDHTGFCYGPPEGWSPFED